MGETTHLSLYSYIIVANQALNKRLMMKFIWFITVRTYAFGGGQGIRKRAKRLKDGRWIWQASVWPPGVSGR
jgi:hypothetical protein